MLAMECLAEFRLDCTLRRLTPRTVSGYYNTNKLCLDFLEGEFGLKELQLIKPTHLKVYFQKLIQKGLKPSYINGVLKAMRAFFKYAVEEGYISDNPVLKVRWQREGKVLISTFTDEEVRRLIGAFDGKSYLSMRNKLILAVAFDTGARNSEICSIAASDIRDNVILLHGKGTTRTVSRSALWIFAPVRLLPPNGCTFWLKIWLWKPRKKNQKWLLP